MKKKIIENLKTIIYALIIALIFEKPTWQGVRLEWFEICYTGIISTAIGYTLQIIAQGRVSPAPAAIILSMEAVFAAVSGWIIINQSMSLIKIFGCFLIFIGIVIAQIFPLMKKQSLNFFN